MTELITGISPQPNFPHEDLTDTNADLLELMIANQDIRASSHAAVERLSWMFRIGHPTILFSAGHIYDEDERLAAINHGVVSFEAITAMVGGNAAVSDMIPTNREASRLLHMETTGLSNYFDEAVDELQTKIPRTAEVVRSSAARLNRALTTYALLGAAMSRKFEMSVMAA
jgi:hypothetical protein